MLRVAMTFRMVTQSITDRRDLKRAKTVAQCFRLVEAAERINWFNEFPNAEGDYILFPRCLLRALAGPIVGQGENEARFVFLKM